MEMIKKGDGSTRGALAARALSSALKMTGSVLGLARMGLEGAKVDLLVKAAANGWNPSMSNSIEWLMLAMREPTGGSITWLLENFPLDLGMSPVMNDPTNVGLVGPTHDWSAKSMLAVEDFALGFCPMQNWVAACASSKQAGLYFKETLLNNERWDEAMRGSSLLKSFEVLAALFHPIRSGFDVLTTKACVDFCSKHLPSIIEQSDAPNRSYICQYTASLALGLMLDGKPLAPIVDLLDCLPGWMLNMGGKALDVWRHNSSFQSRQTELQVVGKELSSLKRAMISCDESNPCWELGAYALCGTLMSNFELALDRGWIGPVDALIEQTCENPDFIAFDQAQIELSLGRQVDMDERWRKSLERIQSSKLSAAPKAGLIARAELRDPTIWSEGQPKVYVLDRALKSSPASLLLACSGSDKKADELLEAKVMRLSDRGYRLKDAMGQGDALCMEIRQKSRFLEWMARVVEREELDGVVRGPGSRGRSASL